MESRACEYQTIPLESHHWSHTTQQQDECNQGWKVPNTTHLCIHLNGGIQEETEQRIQVGFLVPLQLSVIPATGDLIPLEHPHSYADTCRHTYLHMTFKIVKGVGEMAQ